MKRIKAFVRFRILLMIAVLAGMLVTVVFYASPYAPVAQPPMEIEAMWEIEDTRTRSEEPLIAMLYNQGIPLAYSSEQNTFYCALGLENENEWPRLHLTAPGADGVSFCFSDDYTYDWCSDAIADGYAYEMMAYTQEEYDYFNIVFTGLPVIQLSTQREITSEDTPAQVRVSTADSMVESYGRVHARGGLSRGAEKKSYKVEYTRNQDGTKKIKRDTPGIGTTEDLILLAMPYDRSMLRDRLSWEIYGQMTQGTVNFPAPDMRYVELFINEEYKGIYLMFKPFEPEEELEAAGTGNVLTDSLYRTCVANMTTQRPVVIHPLREGAGYEMFYSPDGMHETTPLKAYMDLLTEEDDTVFCQKALACIDFESMLETLIMVQAGGMADNVFNNLYIWAERTTEGYLYHFVPWDMDQSWGMKMEDVGFNFENWMYFPLADRLLELDAGGLRNRLYEMWKRLRCGVLSEQNIEAIIAGYCRELNDSGAMLRNAERWETEHYTEDGFEILDFMYIRFALLDDTISRLISEEGERPLFLERTQYEGKGTPIEWAQE